MARVDFDTYMYSVYTRRYSTASNAAAIHLYNGGALVGSLYFNYDAARANRDPGQSGSRVVLYYHMSILDTIVDMLRNEDSVYLLYNIDAKLGYLNTGREEVGEEES